MGNQNQIRESESSWKIRIKSENQNQNRNQIGESESKSSRGVHFWATVDPGIIYYLYHAKPISSLQLEI